MGLDCDGVRLVLFDNVKSHRDGGVHSRIGYVPEKLSYQLVGSGGAPHLASPQRGRSAMSLQYYEVPAGPHLKEGGSDLTLLLYQPVLEGERYARGSYEKTRRRGST